MNSEKLATDITPHLETAEKAVAAVKDPRLREIAFGRILDHLLNAKKIESNAEKPVASQKDFSKGKLEKPTREDKSHSGATGGLRLLVEQGDLNTPKTASEIIDLMKKEGRHYRRDTVLMGLLNLVRERVLTRFKESGDKNWKYAIRR